MGDIFFERLFKNLILGENVFIRYTSVYKRALLTGTLSLLLLLITIVYLVFDLWSGVYVAIPYYIILIGTACIVFFLNRMRYYSLAKLVLLYTALTILFIFGSSEPLYSGIYLHYFPLILAAFALYGYSNRIYAIIFTVMALASFLVIFFHPVNIISHEPLPEPLFRINFLIHFMVSLGATFFIIMFFIKLNYTIEDYLRKNDIYLGKILKELKASKQRLELAFKGSNAGLYDWDIRTNSIYHAPTWYQMLGYRTSEMEDFSIERFFNLVHPEDRENARKSLESYLQKKSPKFSQEVRVKAADGTYKWIIDSGMALWDEEGTPVRMVGSIMDISEIKEAEARIKQQNKMLEKTNAELDKFVYSTSHDLRAPLMSILGLIDLAKQEKKKTEIKQCLELMANRVHRLDEFIAEIIDFSRNSRLEVDNEEIKLDDMLKEIVKDLQYMDNSDRIALNFDIEKDFLLRSDRKRLETILKNLISNAYKYHSLRKQQPYINISAARINGSAKITIEDNGDGIKPESKAKVFDMFYRGSEKSKGSGLGLYIAKEMADKLKGRIDFESNYGEGSRFTIEIPQ